MRGTMMKNIGKIVQVIGPVVDILFADGHLPAKWHQEIAMERG